MNQWARVNDLFHAALDRPPSDRDAFVARECGGDSGLREEVESLLAAHDANAASVSASRLDVGTRVGDYEVTAFLAAGAMGEVYRARDTKLGREVALKILPPAFVADPDRRTRFEREARLLASMNHPNIATIYGFEEQTDVVSGVSRTVRALAMELVDGETLADRIARGPDKVRAAGPERGSRRPSGLRIDDALRIAKQIAEALEAAHEHGIIHRDLKPANIKLTRDGVVKVLDFGLAKLSLPDDASATISPSATGAGGTTAAGMLLGTPAYMSPEQARGELVDKRTDIWAFGCVLYEMLAGQEPFGGDGVPDTLANVLKTQPDWNALPADVPVLIRALIEGCLEKERSARVADIAAARFAFGRHAIVPGTGHVTADVPKHAAWRRVIPVGVTAVVVGALAFMAAWNADSGVSPPVSTFRVFLGEGQQFTNQGHPVIAISPDGSRIIYVANRRLYTRRMSELDATPIAGTDEFGAVASPALSPDGNSVVFFAQESLKRIAVNGGTAVTICPASNPFGVSWDGDTILFGQSGSGILAVPQNGGQPEVWVKISPDETADSPQLLPEVNVVLFTVTKASGLDRWDHADIVVYSRDSQQRKVVIRGGSAARYVPTGHILYAVRGALMAVPFDLQRLEVTGNPAPILEGVRRSGDFSDTAHFGVSDDGTLTYVPAIADGVLARTLAWVDRQGREESLTTEKRAFNDLRLSPDGQRVAVTIGGNGNEENGNNDIWTFDLARGALTRLTFERDEDETPVWSPDGTWVAYASTEGGQPAVFRRRADGAGPPEALWRAPSPQRPHIHVDDWTSDGRTLVISYRNAPGNTEIAALVMLELDGDRTLTPLVRSRFSTQAGQVSPDGRWIAYVSNESRRDEVFVQTFPSLEGKWQISTGGGVQPVWSRTGDELFYRGEGSVMAASVSSGASFSAGPPQKLFADHYRNPRVANSIDYDVSSDGRRFLMVKEGASDEQTAAPHIVVVLNWLEELKRLVPAN